MTQDCQQTQSQPRFAKQTAVQHHPCQPGNCLTHSHVATVKKKSVSPNPENKFNP